MNQLNTIQVSINPLKQYVTSSATNWQGKAITFTKNVPYYTQNRYVAVSVYAVINVIFFSIINFLMNNALRESDQKKESKEQHKYVVLGAEISLMAGLMFALNYGLIRIMRHQINYMLLGATIITSIVIRLVFRYKSNITNQSLEQDAIDPEQLQKNAKETQLRDKICREMQTCFKDEFANVQFDQTHEKVFIDALNDLKLKGNANFNLNDAYDAFAYTAVMITFEEMLRAKAASDNVTISFFSFTTLPYESLLNEEPIFVQNQKLTAEQSVQLFRSISLKKLKGNIKVELAYFKEAYESYLKENKNAIKLADIKDFTIESNPLDAEPPENLKTFWYVLAENQQEVYLCFYLNGNNIQARLSSSFDDAKGKKIAKFILDHNKEISS